MQERSLPREPSLVGQAVRRIEESGVPLKDRDLAEYQAIHPAFTEDMHTVFDFQRSVKAQNAEGDTAPDALRAQIKQAKALLVQQKGS